MSGSERAEGADVRAEGADARAEGADARADGNSADWTNPAGSAEPGGLPDHPDSAAGVLAPPAGAFLGAPADYPPATAAGRGMFGVSGSGDVSGYGGLVRRPSLAPGTARPYGGYFDDVVDGLRDAYDGFDAAIERVVVDRGELTLFVSAEHIAEVCQVMRDDAALRFEYCSSVSAVDYLGQDQRRLHVSYHLTSMTYRWRVRLEVSVTAEAPHVPTVTAVYPTADWQEREAYDMFGLIFDGHPNLTRILMPDDWEGFPQRKDYPLSGVPVEYKGASIPPPDTRRAYQ